MSPAVLITLLLAVSSQATRHTAGIIHEISALSYKGDIRGLRRLMQDHQIKTLPAESSGRTAVHFALAGQFALAEQGPVLAPGHQAVLDHAIRHSDGSGCPIIDAVHYRNLVAVEALVIHLGFTMTG